MAALARENRELRRARRAQKRSYERLLLVVLRLKRRILELETRAGGGKES
jgi:hypothetical protein